MTVTYPCGCKFDENCHIIYCRTHAAVGDMLAALKKAVRSLRILACLEDHEGITENAYPLIYECEAAIAKAEVKQETG